jgi:hypothetical protein
MAENFDFTPGTGATGAADDIAGVKYPKVKLVDGTEDSTTVIGAGVGAAANGLRVALATASEIVANLSATDNAVLDAIQTAIEACQTALEATLTVSGTVTANLSATDNAVLDAIQTAVEAIQTAITGTVTIDGTVDLGATDNAVLDSILTAVEAVKTAVEATLAISGTVDLGATDNAVLDTIATNTGASLTDTELRATPVPVSGTVTANLSATDNAVLDAIQAAVEILDNAISGSEMQVDIASALPAGDNNIGNVDIASVLPAGTNAIGKLAANSGVDIGDVDVASIAAGENHLGEVGLPDDTITITCSLDTNAYADGDVLFDTQEIANAVRNNGDTCILQSVHVLDKADQGVDFELVFLNAATSLGTENAAISIADADAEDIIGHFAFTNDYVDLINSQIRCEGGIGLPLKAGAATTSLYVAGISKGTGTYGASDILITFGFLRN